MATERTTLMIDAKMTVDSVMSSIKSIRSGLSSLTMPKNLTANFEKNASTLEKDLEKIRAFSNIKLNDEQAKEVLHLLDKAQKDLPHMQQALSRIFDMDPNNLGVEKITENLKKTEEALNALEKSKKDYLKTEKGKQQNNELKERLAAINKAKANLAKANVTDNGKSLQENLSQLEKLKETYGEIGAVRKNLEKDFANFRQNLGFEQSSKKIPYMEAGLKRIATEFEKINKISSKLSVEDKINNAKNLSNIDPTSLQRYISALEALEKLKDQNNRTEYDSYVNKIKGRKELEAGEGYQSYLETARLVKFQQEQENIKRLEAEYTRFEQMANQGTAAATQQPFQNLINSLREAGVELKGIENDTKGLEKIQEIINNLKTDNFSKIKNELKKIIDESKGLSGAASHLENQKETLKAQFDNLKKSNQEMDMMRNRIQYFFGLNNALNLLQRGLRQAVSTVKELDSAMTETAVVTDFSVNDMWSQLPKYTNAANKLGATTLGAYQTMTLFYQQGLDTNQAFALGEETMKMARIANLDYANATNLMTAALRGFNMELNEASATKVNDVYSKLAAITAADTQEIASAMTKTASIANSANMDFETTAAFLSQIIETTRESAETAGTAMKTIIARFTEVRKLGQQGSLIGKDAEGEVININKIDAALKTIGMSLSSFISGEQGLDDIFLELASKWDSLDMATQRYIATTAAGSRQQSRFLAMMSDYERTLELVNAAENSHGAGQEQFEKTQDSLTSKLNNLSNAWDAFTMGLADNKAIKLAVAALTELLQALNKITDLPGGGLLKIGLITSLLRGGGALAQTGVNWLAGTLTGAAGPGAAMQTMKQAGLSEEQMVQPHAYRDFLLGRFLPPYEAFKKASTATFSVPPVIDEAEREKLRTAAARDLYDKMEFLDPEGDLSEIPDDLFDEKVAALEKDYLEKNSSDKTITGKSARMYNRGIRAYENTKTRQKIEGREGRIRTENATFLDNLYDNVRNNKEKKLTKDGIPDKEAKKAAEGLGQLAANGLKTAIILGSLAVAAMAIYGAFKAYDNAHISEKEAKQAAKNNKLAAESSRKKEKEYRSQFADYKKLQEQINLAVKGSQEWNKLVADSNVLVSNLTADIPGVSIDDQAGRLTIDEGVMNSAIREQEKKANFAEALSNFSEQYYQEIKKENLSDKEKNPEVQKQEKRKLEVQNDAIWKQGLSKLLDNSLTARNLSSALNLNLQDKYNKGIERKAEQLVGISKKDLIKNLKELYGLNEEEVLEIYGDGKKLDKEQARIAIAQANSVKELDIELQSKIDSLNQSGIESSQIDLLNRILSGDSTVEVSNLKLESGQLGKYFDILGYDTEEGLQSFMDKATDIFVKQNLQSIRAIEAISPGSSSNEIKETFRSFDLEDRRRIGSVYKDFSQVLGGSDKSFKTLFGGDNLFNNLNYFEDLNLQNPIKGLQQITQYAKSGNKSLQEFGEQLLTINDEEGLFSLGDQFDYLNNTIFSVSENTQNLENEFGELEGNDIYELAKQFEDLDNFLQNSSVSASALASVINAINLDGLNEKLIDESLLKALSSFNSMTSGIEDTIYRLENYKLGQDYGVIADTLKTYTEDFTEMFNAGEYGNAKLASIYDFAYGQGAWNKDVVDYDSAIAAGEKFYSLMSPILESGDTSGLWKNLLGARGISVGEEGHGMKWNEDTQQVEFELDENDTYDSILQSMIDQNSGLSQDLLEAMLANAAVESPELAKIVNKHGVNAAVDEIVAGAEHGIIDTAVVDLIAKNANLSSAEVQDMIRNKNNNIEFGTWSESTLSNAFEMNPNARGYEKIIQDSGAILSLTMSPEEKVQKTQKKGELTNNLSPLWGTLAGALTRESGSTTAAAGLTQLRTNGKFSRKEAEKYLSGLEETTGKDLTDSKAALEEYLGSWEQIQNINKELSSESFLAVDLEKMKEFGTVDEIFSAIEERAENGQEIGEIFSSDFEEGLKIDWDAVANQYNGDLQAWYDDQVDTAKMQQNADIIAQSLIEALSGVKDLETVEITVNGNITELQSSIEELNGKVITILCDYEPLNEPGSSGESGGNASGGIVQSFAKGSARNKIKPGPALTGEEDPEIIWNKEKGYAYLAGANGPEYNKLIPGDRVFNAAETRKILRNSKKKRRPSLAKGGYTPAYDNATAFGPGYQLGNGGASGPSGGRTAEKKDDWKNEFDWLYNLMEDIVELERSQEKFSKIYEKLLNEDKANGKELLKLTREQLSNLYAQKKGQEYAFEKRKAEMQSYLDKNKELSAYGRYNFKDQTVEIDWDKIEAIDNKDKYQEVKDYIDELEDIQDKIDTAEDALYDIQEQIREIEERFEKTYTDFEDRVLKALIDSYQKQIDKLTNVNDTIINTNSKLFDSIQKALDKQRQDRENEETEKDLSEKERRLAFLRQDSSKNNLLEIKQLEEELADARQDYTDNLIDQKLTELQDQEDFAAEQRERQIELMQAQLEWAEASGALWEDVHQIIDNSIDEDGRLLNGSALETLLKESDNWESLSSVQRKVWGQELHKAVNEVVAYLEMGTSIGSEDAGKSVTFEDRHGKTLTGVVDGDGSVHIKGKNGKIWGYENIYRDTVSGKWKTDTERVDKTPIPEPEPEQVIQNTGTNGYTSSSGQKTYTGHYTYTHWSCENGKLVTGKGTVSATGTSQYEADYNAKNLGIDESARTYGIAKRQQKQYQDELRQRQQYWDIEYGANGNPWSRYAAGGLADFTGPAWLDGTKSHPELILSARDTQNFIELKDVLSGMKNSGSSFFGSGDNYYNIDIAATITDDYDVEQLASKIKKEIVKDASYRNVNVINRRR